MHGIHQADVVKRGACAGQDVCIVSCGVAHDPKGTSVSFRAPNEAVVIEIIVKAL